MKDGLLFNFVCTHTLIVWHADASDNGKKTLTLLDDEDDMPREDEAIEMVIPDGFRLQEPRPPDLDSSFVKRGVLSQTTHGWFGDLITRKSARNKSTTTVYILKKTKSCGA